MAKEQSYPIGVQACAVVAGSFLSGKMMGLSLMTVPVLLDTNTQPTHMVQQWVRLYHYGHLLSPALAIATCLIYAHAATRKRASGRQWTLSAAAGAVTVGMIPFTWIVMVPTNNALFGLNEGGGVRVAGVGLGEVQELVGRWGRLHLVRSLFPLVGAVLGFNGLLGELTG
ncbi:hypothetical protein BDR22DRAFT_883676 [Usnea florida]